MRWSILQFRCLGEGKFYHDRMSEFIKVAQDLMITYQEKNMIFPLYTEIRDDSMRTEQ